jgi:hypothetical protein
VAQGQGLVAQGDGQLDGPVELPPPPAAVFPGDDPVYARRDQDVGLSFTSDARKHHLQVLAFDSTDIVVDRDIGLSPETLRVPWLGTWRLRLSSVDARGLEGASTATGYLVVVEE